jgi:hypothetical protein
MGAGRAFGCRVDGSPAQSGDDGCHPDGEAPIHVLVVDDESVVAELVSIALRDDGTTGPRNIDSRLGRNCWTVPDSMIQFGGGRCWRPAARGSALNSGLNDNRFGYPHSGGVQCGLLLSCSQKSKRSGELNLHQIKMLSAVVGGGAVVAMGVLAVALENAPAAVSAPEVSYGETETSTTGVTELETSVAAPPVTATPPDGFGMG